MSQIFNFWLDFCTSEDSFNGAIDPAFIKLRRVIFFPLALLGAVHGLTFID